MKCIKILIFISLGLILCSVAFSRKSKNIDEYVVSCKEKCKDKGEPHLYVGKKQSGVEGKIICVCRGDVAIFSADNRWDETKTLSEAHLNQKEKINYRDILKNQYIEISDEVMKRSKRRRF